MPLQSSNLKHQAFLLTIGLYWTYSYWITLIPTLAYLFWIGQKFLHSPKVKAAENWNAVIVGAGFAGLDAGVKLKEMGMKFTILEKSSRLGGTWWDNQYPGAACDIASHLYSLSYYLNPWWSRAYSKQAEILEYLESLASHFNLYPYIEFNTRVENSVWNDEKSKWIVSTSNGKTIEANFLFSGVGLLHIPNDTRFTDDDKFKGPKFHTANWLKDIDLRDKKVAVIGTGASGVQVVPNIVQDVKELHVFQRTPGWVPPRHDFEYPVIIRSLFAVIPILMSLHRFYFWAYNEILFRIVFDSRWPFLINFAKNLITKEITKAVNDPELAKRLLPNYNLGCKRITPSDKYLQAFNLSHVHLNTDKIDRMTPEGIVTKNSKNETKETKCDVIIMATGFSILNSATKSLSMVGRSGKKLQDQWLESETPRAYLGITTPDIPNAFICHGPNTGLGHNSVIYMLECQNNYSIDCIKKLIESGHKSMECKKETIDTFYDYVYSELKNRVFASGGCSAWYLNSKGVNWSLWSGDLTQYWLKTRKCNLNDYILK